MEGVVTTSLMNVAVEGVVGWGSGGSGQHFEDGVVVWWGVVKWMNTLSKLNASDTSQHLHKVFFGESLQLAVTRHCYSYYSYCEYYHLTPNMSPWLDLCCVQTIHSP